MSSTSALASSASCSGSDGYGNAVFVYLDFQSPVVTINGLTLRLVGPTRSGQGVVTENFINRYGILSYDSLNALGPNALGVYQFNAVTNALLASAVLNCNLYAVHNIKEMKIFKNN